MLKEDEYIENLEEYKIIQKEKGYKFGIDTVLLSKFVKEEIKNNMSILDIGSGNGIIEILLNKEIKNKDINDFYAIDIQQENIDRAIKMMILNKLEKKFLFECCDVREYKKSNYFDLIISNPPYMMEDGKKQSVNSHRAISRHEISLNLKEFIKNSKRLLKPIGKLCFIHRSFRLVEIIKELDENKFSIEKIIFIYSENNETNMMYVQSVKGKKMKLEINNFYIK